jgi:gas vesicle protein
MFRRLFWLVVGAGFGFGVSFWLMRFVRETAARYTPERVSSDLADALKGLGADLRAAVAEGREAMREREVELRSDVEHRAQSVHQPG